MDEVATGKMDGIAIVSGAHSHTQGDRKVKLGKCLWDRKENRHSGVEALESSDPVCINQGALVVGYVQVLIPMSASVLTKIGQYYKNRYGSVSLYSGRDSPPRASLRPGANTIKEVMFPLSRLAARGAWLSNVALACRILSKWDIKAEGSCDPCVV